MRLLHTSDWHLGRQFHGASLLEEQAAAVDRIVELASEARVDAVVIAGDLYDRAIPPGPAVELLDDALVRLRATGAVVVAIGGNHDSPTRVGFGDRLLGAAGVTVRSDLARAAEPVIVTPADDGEPVALYPVPFADPLAVSLALPDSVDGRRRSALTHQQALQAVLRPVVADRRSRGLRSVLVAHAFVANTAPQLDEDPVQVCDSERDLAIGGSALVDTSVVSGFDYVALGHLHGRQAWDGGRVAYSGSPLRYSFSEERHHKSVRIVELGGPGGATGSVALSVEQVDLGVGRPLCTVTGALDDLLADPLLEGAVPARVRAVLTDPVLPPHAMARLRGRFPHTAELVHRPPECAGDGDHPRSARDVRSRDPLDLALDFLAAQWDEPAAAADRELLAEALTNVSGAPA
jgi:DNA repair protein SbcD/Mre11